MFAAVFALVACEMDLYRSDKMTAAMFASNPAAAVYSTDGNYAMFKDELEFGMTDRGGFVHLYWLMTELLSDNATLSGKTEDPLWQNNTYDDNDRLEDLSYMWYICYKIIYGCNVNIESLPVGQDVETDHLVGENYFLRAVCHLSLCNLFATPYSRGPEKLGVVIRNSTDCSVTTRATVGEVYTQIESDLKKAMEYMKAGSPRGNKGYASYEAAAGLLTRIYLYMERNDECLELCNELIDGDPASKLDPSIETYFANALTSKETLWCIGRHANDAAYVGSVKGQISSMYYKPVEGDRGDGGDGWCEVYWSEPLIDLMTSHPEDKRNEYLVYYGRKNDGLKYITWPEITEDYFRNYLTKVDIAFDDNAASNSFEFNGKTYTVKKKQGNGYPIYYIEGMYTEAEDYDGVQEGTRCCVRDNVSKLEGMRKSTNYVMYGMSKFTFQDGKSALSSPVFIRWAEVILNRAEANAKLGNDADALADVNVIRTRAGLSGDALWSVGNIGGYETVLDVVLDERRLEFCFEGFRAIDQYRNGKDLDRRFGGVHPYEVLTPADMDIRYPYCIPYTETSVSGIPGNGRQ